MSGPAAHPDVCSKRRGLISLIYVRRRTDAANCARQPAAARKDNGDKWQGSCLAQQRRSTTGRRAPRCPLVRPSVLSPRSLGIRKNHTTHPG